MALPGDRREADGTVGEIGPPFHAAAGIDGAQGAYPGQSSNRSFDLQLINANKPGEVHVNGVVIPVDGGICIT